MSAFRRRSPAVRLLERVLQTAQADQHIVRASLGLSAAEMEAFRSGAERMPAELRLRLASLVVARFPEHVPAARRVADQAEAEIAFRDTTTVTHLSSPHSRFK